MIYLVHPQQKAQLRKKLSTREDDASCSSEDHTIDGILSFVSFAHRLMTTMDSLLTFVQSFHDKTGQHPNLFFFSSLSYLSFYVWFSSPFVKRKDHLLSIEDP